MNFMKVFSVTLTIVFLSLFVTPGSDATGIWIPIHPLHVFTAAKLATLGIIGKGAVLGGIGIPLAAKKLILLKSLGGAAVVGGLAGAKTGLIASSLKAPLFLAKSALPNLISLTPLLKGIGKKGGIGRSAPLPAAPLPPPPPPMLPPPPPPAPVMAPSYAPQSPSYGAPLMAPMAPTYSQPMLRSNGFQ